MPARLGRRTVELLELRPGGRVPGVGCGTGASALPATGAVGPTGQITGIDVAESMLRRARAKAAAQGLANVRFLSADMMAPGLADESFDAVVSVFSIFFAADIDAQSRELWRLVRPGGRLAVTVWAPDTLEPAGAIFAEELRRLRPDLPRSTPRWERLTDPTALRRLMLDGGTSEPVIHSIGDRQPLSQPADWWTIALGSGLCGTVDQLTPEQKERLRSRTLARLAEDGVAEIETGALCAIARKELWRARAHGRTWARMAGLTCGGPDPRKFPRGSCPWFPGRGNRRLPLRSGRSGCSPRTWCFRRKCRPWSETWTS